MFSMIIKHVTLCKFVSLCKQLAEDAAWVEVVYLWNQNMQWHRKSISWSMVDGMSEKQQNHQLKNRLAQVRAALGCHY